MIRYTIYRTINGRFKFLLISLLLMIALGPFIQDFIRATLVMNFFFSAILLSTVFAVSERSRDVVISLCMGLPMVLLMWGETATDPSPFLQAVGLVFGMSFTAYVTIVIFLFIQRQTEVTRELLYAAVVVYLMIGLIWYFIFHLIEMIEPGSFSKAELKGGQNAFLYYSYVTLTTLGYGDITPLTDKAYAATILEAIVGQMYLVIQVAWLVGLYTSQSQENRAAMPAKAHRTDLANVDKEDDSQDCTCRNPWGG